MARKPNIIPVLAIGGIVGAVFFLGGKKKKAKAAPSRPDAPNGNGNGQNGEPPAPGPSPTPVAPGPLECPAGWVEYPRVVPDPNATYVVRGCVPADMVEAMLNTFGPGEVDITKEEIAAWERGERWMIEAGKGEPPTTGISPGAPPTPSGPDNLFQIEGSASELSDEDQDALMGLSIGIVSDENGEFAMETISAIAGDHLDVKFVLLDAQANAPVPAGTVTANVDLERVGDMGNWLEQGPQAIFAALDALPEVATRTFSPAQGAGSTSFNPGE